jgi:hypothetical protein
MNSYIFVSLASGLLGLAVGIMMRYLADRFKQTEVIDDEVVDETKEDAKISSYLRISIARDVLDTLLENDSGFNSDPEARAQSAVAYADALIKELKGTNDLKSVEVTK